MNSIGSKIKNCKRRGEWVELQFMTRAAEYQLNVSKPWGDSARYDIGIEHRGRFLRVQVKSTLYRRFGGPTFSCTLRASNKKNLYTCEEVDFFAAYVIPLDAWYIIPAHVIIGRTNILLWPQSQSHKYEPYREAWHLLLGKTKKARAKSAATD